MTRDESLKKRICDVFRYHVFRFRDSEGVGKVLSCNFPGSTVRVLDEFNNVEVTGIDLVTDKVVMNWDDGSLEMEFKYASSGNQKDWVLVDVK
jgi:hypothetical protein